VARVIPYGSIPRNEIITIEKQILRDISMRIKDNVEAIAKQPAAHYLLPITNATLNLLVLADTLEDLGK